MTIGVGRPALSNFLNGNAALSPDMAVRLQKAFSADPDDLMNRQAKYDASRRPSVRTTLANTRTYVPPFLMVKANDVEAWADEIDSRSRLPVLLRNLVHSTCGGLKHVDFPGNDDSQRPGWDGIVETTQGNPWVPAGTSAWEFGADRDIKSKANKEYAKRTAATKDAERQNTTFVFVTPRRWHGKTDWVTEKRGEGKWQGVLAWDSSDIEQWLEQSISAQAWFGDLRGFDMGGVKSLDKCWVEWCADCEPTFTAHIFDEAMASFGSKVRSHLHKADDGLLRIVADSREEGLAFLYTVLSRHDDLRGFLDRMVVFTKRERLPKLAVGSPGFIPVITDVEIEKELAQSGCKLKGFVIEWRTAVQRKAAVTLEPLSHEAFRKSLESMGLDRDEIERRDRESGRSLTVLRRRLARNEALRSPNWSTDQELAEAIAPMMLAGAWNTNNDADRYLMRELAGVDDKQLESQFSRLLHLEDSPVWSAGDLHGVVSKVDALYAAHGWINPELIERFMEVAEVVLSEPDPSLELPEEDRPMASVFGKSREISSPFRKGLAESLVLLAIHGGHLFGKRTGLDPESMVAAMVRGLLEPMTANNLLSQASNLPLYAEAAPHDFLSILELDLDSEQPAAAALMEPVTDTIFGRHDRIHLLTALDVLGWSPEWLPRVVELLGTLAELEPNDNIVSKPSESLLSLLGWWMPQTGASLEQRTAAFDLLTEQHPGIAWQVATSQFSGRSRLSFHKQKPLWRGYALGWSENVPIREARAFKGHCIETCLNWLTAHTREQLGDLAERFECMNPQQRDRLGEAIADWSVSANDRDTAWLRERIRVNLKRMARRATKYSNEMPEFDGCVLMANNAIEVLEPEDVVWKHAWLFQRSWVEEGWDNIEEDTDLAHRARYVRSLRLDAIRKVIANSGIAGVLKLAFTGQGADVAGQFAAEAIRDDSHRLELARFVLADGDVLTSERHQAFLFGFLRSVDAPCAIQLVDALWPEYGEDTGVKLLCLSEFVRTTWTKVRELGVSVSVNYWTQVNPTWRQHNNEDTNYVVFRLLEVNRALSALGYAYLDWERVDSALIHRILTEMPNCDQVDFSGAHLDQYSIEQAFKVLKERDALRRSEMARLEFLYFEIFWPETGKMPSLEEEIEANPELFCEAITLAFNRDSSEEKVEPSDNELAMAEKAHKLLGSLSRIPGHEKDGNLSADKLTEWIRKAQQICTANGRRYSGDHYIGQLLANAPEGDDGVWPCVPVREALDSVLNGPIEKGFHIGTYNSRGVHARAEGGAQERDLAERYENWAKACDYSFPRVAAALRGLAKGYLRDACWEDQEAAVQRRLGY